jgi:predicted AlkP superfamily phosphohydrolase/phosphomutase
MLGRLLLACAVICIAACDRGEPEPIGARTIVLGFDGMDPQLAREWMDAGALPHFATLAARGHFAELPTVDPPQSPVAWSSFATGTGPGEHGIYDFLRRQPGSYAPEFSIAGSERAEPVKVLGLELPGGDGALINRRQGEPFWIEAERSGHRASVLRLPVTFPPDPIQRMLAGMGVPDLLGSQGTYTLVTTRRLPGADQGGRVIIARLGEDGILRTELPGPPDPVSPSETLSVTLTLRDSDAGALLDLGDQRVELEPGRWSPFVPLTFRWLGVMRVPAQVRLLLLEDFPRPLLYISPLQIDPLEPVVPISSPSGYAAELASRIGRYHTLGMPEETWSLTQGHMSEQGWLDLVRQTLAEGEAMLYDTLDRRDSDLVVKVFVQPDRVSHMFWRARDPLHPLYPDASPVARGAIEWIYRESDRVLGEVMRRLGPDDRLIVLSDHGFTSFRRAVHLNRWLQERGWLVLREGAEESAPLFDAVDWSRTRAYALGLNGIYLNRIGREPAGVVGDGEADALVAEIREALSGLVDPADGTAMVSRAHAGRAIYRGPLVANAPDIVVGYAAGYRASWQTSLGAVPRMLVEDNRTAWSGDHCVDARLVPGVLFTSFPLTEPAIDMPRIRMLVMRALAEQRSRR